jgi:hypothetical protein
VVDQPLAGDQAAEDAGVGPLRVAGLEEEPDEVPGGALASQRGGPDEGAEEVEGVSSGADDEVGRASDEVSEGDEELRVPPRFLRKYALRTAWVLATGPV